MLINIFRLLIIISVYNDRSRLKGVNSLLLIEAIVSLLVENSLVKERGWFTESYALMCGCPILLSYKLLAIYMISAAS